MAGGVSVLYGLIGASLAHSFSADFFRRKFSQLGLTDHEYRTFELATLHGFPQLIKDQPALRGLNVTFPYKEAIIEYLDELSEEAAEIGAVNCIRISQGRTKGFNTDVYGFMQSIKPFLDRNHERALLLGTGGAAKAVSYGLKKLGIAVFHATSAPQKAADRIMLYENINENVIRSCKLIVNCTPLGMFPATDQLPNLPYQHFTSEHLAYDLIYNPAETLFLKKAREAGAVTVNGLSMLHLQAEKSWEIWNHS